MTDSSASQRDIILQRVSHEFRTPLTIIQNSVDILHKYDSKLSEKQRHERLHNIAQQVDWLNVLLEDILKLLELDQDHPVAHPKKSLLLRDVVQIVLLELERYRLETSRIEIHIRSDREFQGVHDALVSILVQLLSNAIKFSQKPVILDLSVAANTLVIAVIDQGIGIPLKEQKKVFEPLARGSNLDEVSGIGMGLAIVSRQVAQMGGTIELNSVVGEGTTITVRIPL